MNIPPGYVELTDGSFGKPSHCGRLVSVKPVDAVDKESKLHADIEAFCQSKGWGYTRSRMDKKSTCPKGTCDFIIAADNAVTLWVEAKARDEKPTTEQLGFLAHRKKLGHKTAVVRSMSEFIRVTEEAAR